MRRVLPVLAWAVFAATQHGGCADRGHSGTGTVVAGLEVEAAPPSAGKEAAYPNGHPLLAPTGDPVLLAAEERLLGLTNSHRVGMGLPALVEETTIRDVSRAHSMHMAFHGFFAHSNPEGDGPGDRLAACGISWAKAGENIAAGQSAPEGAFADWLASAGHRANIEHPDWTRVGNGVWIGGAYGRYYTQNFILQP